jgi:hypothetical protein
VSDSSGRSPFPRELAEAIGHVVLEASQCEDALGGLVVLHRNEWDAPDFDWWTSGERLADAVQGLDDAHAASIAADYRTLLHQRHMVVHGLWLPGSNGHLNMMRTKSTRASPSPPAYDVGIGSEGALTAIASAFNRLEHRASDAISRYMGLQ